MNDSIAVTLARVSSDLRKSRSDYATLKSEHAALEKKYHRLEKRLVEKEKTEVKAKAPSSGFIRRHWTLAEIQEVRRLRDEEGMTYKEISKVMGVPHDKCRGIYHTGRTCDLEPSGRSLQRKYGISQYDFLGAMDSMGRGASTVKVAEAILGYKIEESK